MKKGLTKKQIEQIKKLGWNVEDCEDCYEISKYSNAGEDFSIMITKDNTINELKECYSNFDEEEHIEQLVLAKINGDIEGIPSIKALVEDAEYISDMLYKLSMLFERGDNER